MIELNPEVIDFRAASGFFEGRRSLTQKDLETLDIILDYQHYTVRLSAEIKT